MGIGAFLKRHEANAVVAAVLGSGVSIVISVISTYLTYSFSVDAQSKQVKYEALAKFSQSGSTIIQVGSDFIWAINSKQDLAGPKEKIKILAADQINETEDLRKFFREDGDLRAYQDALNKFNDVAANVSDLTQMKDWAESFGAVMDTRSALTKELYGKLGVKS